jgi:hypothetical protein
MKFVVSVLHRSNAVASTTQRIGEYAQFDDAVAAARQVIDAALNRLYVAGITASQLVAHYEELAQAPYIFRDDDGTLNASSFNHFRYAKERSDEICAGVP